MSSMHKGEEKATDEGLSSKPVHLIRRDDKGKFCVSDEGRAFFRALSGRFAIVGIAGPMRYGKSFIMNLLNKQMGGFPLGHRVTPETQGVWLWLGTETFKDKDGPYRLILLDFEGLYDPARDPKYDVGLFLFAVLLSSYLIYNTMGRIDHQQLDQLKLVSKVGQQLKVKSNGQGDRAAHFPHLLWVLRDFALDMSEFASPRHYLDAMLNPQETDPFNTEQTGDATTSKLIRMLFPNRDCFPMVRPVINDEDLRNLEQLRFDQLRAEFRKNANDLQAKVYRELKPKVLVDSDGRHVDASGATYVVYMDALLDAFNNDRSLCIEDAWTRVAERSCTEAMNQANQQFRTEIAECERAFDGQAVELATWNEAFQGIFERAVRVYVGAAVLGNPSEKYKSKLQEDMADTFAQVLLRNEEASRKQCERWIQANYTNFTQAVKDRAFQSMEQVDKALDLLENEWKNAKGLGPWKAKAAQALQQQKSQLQNQAMLTLKASEEERKRIEAEQEAERKHAELLNTQASIEELKVKQDQDAKNAEIAAKLQEARHKEAMSEAKAEQEKRIAQVQEAHREAIAKGQEEFGGQLKAMQVRHEKLAQEANDRAAEERRAMESRLDEQIKVQRLQNEQHLAQMKALQDSMTKIKMPCCFPLLATVNRLVDYRIETVRVTEIREGDLVASLDDAGQLTFTEVYFVDVKHMPSQMTELTWLNLNGSEGWMRCTREHLVYKSSDAGLNLSQLDPVTSDSIQCGDSILVCDPLKGCMGRRKVETTRLVSSYGLVTVLVKNHRLLVNDALVSAFEINHTWGIADTVVMRTLYAISPQFVSSQANKRFCRLYDEYMDKLVLFVRDSYRRGAQMLTR